MYSAKKVSTCSRQHNVRPSITIIEIIIEIIIIIIIIIIMIIYRRSS